MFCLSKDLVEIFKEKLKSGEINPEKMSKMTSEERRSFFAEFLGNTNAEHVNALFESKLLLQHQQEGIINWAKQTAGMKPEAQRDIISRVNKMTEILTPQTEDAFLADLAAHKLGVTVTMEEAAKIAELAKKAAVAKEAMKMGGDRMIYGRAREAFGSYINKLKEESQKKSFKETIKNPGEIIKNVAGSAKSLKASLDNSAIFRQGWRPMLTNPGIWLSNAAQSFANIIETFGKDRVMSELHADIVSRPTYDLMQKAKLAVGTIEEAYPNRLELLQRVPVLGKLYKASENAFTAFVFKTRADIFDEYIKIANKTGVDLTNPVELKSIGKLVNSLTGRGALGRFEPGADVINNVFFSPRNLKSQWDALTGHTLGTGLDTSFTRKMAATNWIKIIGGTAAIMTIAKLLGGQVETDPRSADFGKLRIGDTRFDISGGMSGLVVLASRIATFSSKSSTTGNVTPLNTGKYGSQTVLDVFLNFTENKLSPVAAVIKDLMKGQDFNGNKPSITGEVSNLLAPLPITNFQELATNSNAANIILGTIADSLGIGVNTYSPKGADWSTSTSTKQITLRKKYGEEKMSLVNAQYNKAVEANKKLANPKSNATIEATVLKENGVIYKAPKKKKTKLL